MHAPRTQHASRTRGTCTAQPQPIHGISTGAHRGTVVPPHHARTQLAAGPTVGDGRSRLQLGLYLSSIARVGTHGLSREHARAIIKGVEGNCLELGVHRSPPPGAARGGAPALWPPPQQQQQRAAAAAHGQPPMHMQCRLPMHGWAECADGGYVREDRQEAPPTWHDGQGNPNPNARRDPFLAFAMAGTDVPPAQPGRQDLPRRVHARTPPC